VDTTPAGESGPRDAVNPERPSSTRRLVEEGRTSYPSAEVSGLRRPLTTGQFARALTSSAADCADEETDWALEVASSFTFVAAWPAVSLT